jgi:hypothetical protein
VLRQIDLAEEAVGRFDFGDDGQLQLLDRRPCKVPNMRSERPRASGE